MTLRYPFLLLLWLVIPLLVYLRHAGRHRPTIAFSDGKTLSRIRPSLAVRAQPLLAVLYGLGLVLLVVAMARPQQGLDESVVRTEAVDIVLLADLSTSMLAEDFSEHGTRINRLDAAKKVMEQFIKARENDRIGMVAFAAMPYSVSPLTLDHGWLLQQMERLEPGMLEDGTAIGDALASAINRLRDSKAKSKVVVLLTDGVNNAGTLSPENAAQAAKALGIKVYTVGAGSSGWVNMPIDHPLLGHRYQRVFSEIDEGTLKRIARITDAAYFRATDLKTLREVYQRIDEMEKTEIDVEQFTRFKEAFAPFLALSLLLLGLEKILSLTRLGRIP